MNNPSSPYQLQHSDFSDEVNIICPKCAGKALVKGSGLYHENAEALTYCVCIHCGYNQKYQEKKADFIRTNSSGKVFGHRVQLLSGEVDPFFHHPLWYSVSCLEGFIWAYNVEHLELIEAFIAATNRSRNGLPYKNSSIAARLPKWMSAAKNRGTVLKCIRELKLKK
jgi:Zn ribbon nucleic-acid-binding protein